MRVVLLGKDGSGKSSLAGRGALRADGSEGHPLSADGGGPGKTTVAGVLARLFAEQDIDVLAVDPG